MGMAWVRKGMGAVLGVALVGGLVVAPGALILELDNAQPRIVDHLTMDAWYGHRAVHVDEDGEGWDCRLDGNMICGSPDNAAYALSCASYAVTNVLCALERRSL